MTFLVVVGVLWASFLKTLGTTAGEDSLPMPWTQFLAELSSGRVAELRMTSGYPVVEGVLRAPLDTLNSHVVRITTTAPVTNSDAVYAQLSQSGIPITVRARETSVFSALFEYLPLFIMAGFFFWYLRRAQDPSRTAQQFGKNRRGAVMEIPEITMDAVAGADEAKAEISEIVEFLKDPQSITRLGGRMPRGALLIGPAGTGKTLLAKAAAGTAGRPFFSLSGSDFVEMFVGVGAARVRDLFAQARASAPCIIFIDEIDAVGRQRGVSGQGGSDEREQTLNQLLVEMDGFQSGEGIVVLGATNRPDVLDPALLRPGRFDRHITVGLPDAVGRLAILHQHAARFVLEPDLKLELLARQTAGMSGADLANVLNEAAVMAARRQADKITLVDIEGARDKITFGLERVSMTLSPQERRLTAVHEAGHTIMSLTYPDLDPLHKVSIIPRGRALGITAYLPQEDRHSYTRLHLTHLLVMFMGGRAAELHVFGRDGLTTGAQNDIERATQMARRMVTQFGMSDRVGPCQITTGDDAERADGSSERTREMIDDEVRRMLEKAHQEAVSICEDRKDDLMAITDALLERETLTAKDIAVLLGLPEPQGPLRPAPVPLGDEVPASLDISEI